MKALTLYAVLLLAAFWAGTGCASYQRVDRWAAETCLIMLEERGQLFCWDSNAMAWLPVMSASNDTVAVRVRK